MSTKKETKKPFERVTCNGWTRIFELL